MEKIITIVLEMIPYVLISFSIVLKILDMCLPKEEATEEIQQEM